MNLAMSFSTPMVLARLAGSKWATRRTVTRANSLMDGYVPTAEAWAALDWSTAVLSNTRMAWMVKSSLVDGWRVRVTPRAKPGDVLVWCEATQRADCWACYSAGGNYVLLADGSRAEWRKADGTPYRVSCLAPRYMPRAWSRFATPILSVTPSTPADVNTHEEAFAEGLCTVETEWGLAMGWRGLVVRSEGACTWTPAEAYAALLASLHGGTVDPSTPMWRFEVAR